MGIGQVGEQEAREVWQNDRQHRLRDIDRYIAWLERNAVPETQVGKITPSLRFQVAPPEGRLGATDAFSKAIFEEQCIIVPDNQLESLPEDFRLQLKPLHLLLSCLSGHEVR
jgi:hypothetical protein